MYEVQWDALAEIRLSNKDYRNEIYCLCSRVFIRSRDERLRLSANICDDFSASETEALKEEDACTTENTFFENLKSDEFIETKHEVDTEVVSCYCSASHTDNISTDEHDSLRESHINTNKPFLSKGLQSSDSGADLTEYVKNDYDSAWQKYWAAHGERIIWNSWIAKYSAYINPDFLNTAVDNVLESPNIPKTTNLSVSEVGTSKFSEHSRCNNKFSFDKRDLDKFSNDLLESSSSNLGRIDENFELKDCVERRRSLETAHNNCMLIRALSGSDSCEKLHSTEISEGWNPLSPASLDYEIEAERLLSSRCGSHASSSARTIDSMTNVTHMTISSFDFSDSSKTSDSFSSVSSVQSSLSSTCSEEIEDANDYEQQWNTLWKKHYEEEYLEQYKKFLHLHADINADSFKETNTDVDDQPVTSDEKQEGAKNFKKVLKLNNREKRSSVSDKNTKIKSKRSLGAVGYLLSSLKMNDSSNTVSMDESEVDVDENIKNKKDARNVNVQDSEVVTDENLQMRTMGLPLAFGKKNSLELLKEKKSVKRSHESDTDSDDQSFSDHIKSAFVLMGIEFSESDQPKLKGQVDYKMKHIRLQNRHLKLHRNLQTASVRPQRHIYYDEDGNEIPEDKDSEEVILQNLSQNSDDKQSTSSNEDEVELNRVSISPQDVRDDNEKVADNNVTARKKKRKRKINLPAEIKENPKLKRYWNKRFSLFSKFDMGVKLDEESWYSVTPELVAKNTAERLKCNVIIDAFCGAGGNSIQFALTCKHVIAIDIDPKKIDLARNNAEVYGVADKIDFIVGDFFQLCDKMVADAIFLSPPWGGPAYRNLPTYELEDMLQPVPLSNLLEAARKITKNVALFLPRNSNTYPLLIAAGPGGNVEIEQNFVNKKLIAITAYYNDLIKHI